MPDSPIQTELEKRLQAMQGGIFARPAVQPAVQTDADAVAVQQAEETEYANHFANLLAQNEAYRQQQSAAWEKREKENKARKTWAAISDALSSLGNLVGTGFGAANQQQTYQMPFVQQDIEAQRALDRATADRIRSTEQSLRLAESRSANNYNPLELELLKQQGRQSLQKQKTADTLAIEEAKHGHKIDLKKMDQKFKGDQNAIVNELKRQGIQINKDKLAEMIRHNQTMEVIDEEKAKNSGGGKVGGYKVVITRDEYGREISRERIPTTNNLNVNWEDDNSGPRVEWE